MFKKSKKIEPSFGRRDVKNHQDDRNKAVFSYYQNRDTTGRENTSKERGAKPTLLDRLKHAPSIIAGLVIIVCVGYSMVLEPSARLDVLNESDSLYTENTAQYVDAAQDLLNNSLLSRTKVTIDTASIEAQLQEKFPEITEVAVVIPLIGRTPMVYVRLAEPRLVLESGSQKFIIDEKGRAVSELTEKTPRPTNSIRVKDRAGISINPGDQILPQSNVVFMQSVKQLLEEKKLIVDSMELPARAHELTVRFKGLPYYGKFIMNGDARLQAGSFLATKAHLEKNKQSPKSYIDVRVEERAYYR